MSVTVNQVIEFVGHAFEVPPHCIRGNDQTAKPAAARKVAGWLLHHKLGLSVSETSKAMGGKDHSTGSFWIRRVDELRSDSPEFARMLRALEGQIELAVRLDGLSAIDILELSKRVSTSRLEALKPTVNEIIALGATFCLVWDVALTADALAEAATAPEPDAELIQSLAAAIREEMNALCSNGEDDERDRADD